MNSSLKLNYKAEHDLLILVYHKISETDISRRLHSCYSFPAKKLREQFQLIQRLGIPVVSLVNFSSECKPGIKIMLTFDDANESDYKIVYPLLQEFNFKAAFFLPLNNIVSEKQWKEYGELHEAGHIIASHGISHKYFTNMSASEIKFEIIHSSEVIRKKTESACEYFAFPGGRYNQNLLLTFSEFGFKNVFSTAFNFNLSNPLPFILNRWQIRNNTSIKEFNDVLLQRQTEIIKKKIRNYVINKSKFILGDKYFDNIRKIILET